MKLSKIISIYLDYERSLIKQKTYIFYCQINNIYIQKFNKVINLKNITDFICYIRTNYSYSTTKIIKSLINRSLAYAFENNIINENIFIKIKLKKNNSKTIQALSYSEQTKLENYITIKSKPYYFGILLSLYTGLRLGELLALKWEDVDFKSKLILVNKTISVISVNHKNIVIEDLPKTNSSYRQIPISTFLQKKLIELKRMSKCNYVISSTKNTRVFPRAYQRSFECMLEKLQIKHYGFHSLRHTFATQLLEKKVDIKTISELLGHSNPSITLNTYVHTNWNNKRKAMDIITKNKKNNL